MSAKPKSKLWLILLLALVVLAIVFAGAFYYPYYTYQRDVARIRIQNVDLGTIADGRYTGRCDVGVLAATVRITVRDHRMVDLELLEHKNNRGQAANAIADDMFIQQRIDVDTVTGATNSSKVIQQAAYNALTRK